MRIEEIKIHMMLASMTNSDLKMKLQTYMKDCEKQKVQPAVVEIKSMGDEYWKILRNVDVGKLGTGRSPEKLQNKNQSKEFKAN